MALSLRRILTAPAGRGLTRRALASRAQRARKLEVSWCHSGQLRQSIGVSNDVRRDSPTSACDRKPLQRNVPGVGVEPTRGCPRRFLRSAFACHHVTRSAFLGHFVIDERLGRDAMCRRVPWRRSARRGTRRGTRQRSAVGRTTHACQNRSAEPALECWTIHASSAARGTRIVRPKRNTGSPPDRSSW